MFAKRDDYLNEAYKQLDVISQDKLKRIEYTSRQKALNDHNTIMAENYDRGMNKGIEIGEKKGRLEERESLKEMLMANGMSEEQISEMFNNRPQL